MRWLAALAWVFVAGGALAQTDPADAARAAAQRLAEASEMLEAADGARNRVKALTETIQAYQDGLQAMREGLRRAAIREETLSRDLQSREDEVAQLLGVLMAMGDTPAPVLLLHPSGPVGTARSGMIVAEVTPALNARAADLRQTLEEVTILRALQQSAVNTLRDGLEGVQEARTALSKAIADRTDLPRRFTEDPLKTALLIASTETLEGFASGLNEIAQDEVPGSLPGIEDRKGQLNLPVDGRILRRAGEADAAGITRPGIVMVTRPQALVTAPTAATVRYRGPLLDYGNVIILEPQAGILLVLAGLDVVYGEAGQVLPGGSPVGLMGGATDMDDVILTGTGQETGARQTETLYIEVRENNTPVNPLEWFRTDKDD
ncbi:Septal ring factor EnvC, activator of murein hydrolases AmiA and AmiB [Roseovarius litoreus]|uniref:Septal ring factor EnvC, activator of murein hydrolases AmiA and AmiB n=1 Tax=Roseovarius litoreus TaxID=1155722 RepID=A0A1M7AEK4_9RHOB|nr:peptidoglycan DD-metalloendopeptidase family protein [Roseovarius litoreus]SHL41142.1 Septal ring factor EnvC, activator of murein hydrolases AmiA and AmiB [Roseovarius litoreus]